MAWFITIRWLAGLGVLARHLGGGAFASTVSPAAPLYLSACSSSSTTPLPLDPARLPPKRAHVPTSLISSPKRRSAGLAGDDRADPFFGRTRKPRDPLFLLPHHHRGDLAFAARTFLYAAMAALLVGARRLEYAGGCRICRLANASRAAVQNPVFIAASVFFASAMFVAAYLASTSTSPARAGAANRRR